MEVFRFIPGSIIVALMIYDIGFSKLKSRILILLLALITSIAYSKSLRDTNITKNLKSIFTDFKFDQGEPTWRPGQDTHTLPSIP